MTLIALKKNIKHVVVWCEYVLCFDSDLHTTLMVKLAITLHTVLVDGLGANLTTFLVVLVRIEI